MRLSPLIPALAAVALSPAALATPEDRALLIDGVREIAAPGQPGPLCVTGADAFVVVVGGGPGATSAPVVAAATFGKGRVVAFGHDGYLSDASLKEADTRRLLENAIRWTTREKKSPRLSLRNIGSDTYWQGIGYDASVARDPDWMAGARTSDVICVNTGSLTASDIAGLTRYVQDGGGLIALSLGWGWLQLNPGKDLRDHPGNRLLGTMGILWADGQAERTGRTGYTMAAPPPLSHAGAAVEALSKGGSYPSAAEVAQAAAVSSSALLTLPPDDTLLLPELLKVAARQTPRWSDANGKALVVSSPLDRLSVVAELDALRRLPADRVRAHPASAVFPGAVAADTPRVLRVVRIRIGEPAWYGTGLYAAPGEAVTVTVPPGLAGQGASVRIGAHTDTLWHLPAWERAPEISRSFPLQEPVTVVANAFGGAVFIETTGQTPAGSYEITIKGAVEAPRFVRGETTLHQWRERLRSLPAPWAELEGNHAVLTVPSGYVRALDDPESVLAFWDDAMDAIAHLAGYPGSIPRPERYVADRQISAGYMHSGYPIMTGTDVCPLVVDLQRLRREGSWGHFHEAGHNYQLADWTFDGAGEVTNNLFSVYLYERLCGTFVAPHPALDPQVSDARLSGYLAGGAQFHQWKSNPFLALTMYLQLRDAFGWESFRSVFAQYRDLPPREHPQTDDRRRDEWMVRFSRQVGVNLGPFFEVWGVPTSEAARKSIAELPEWLPERLKRR